MNRRMDLILYVACALLLLGAGTIWWRGVRPAPPGETTVEVAAAAPGATSLGGGTASSPGSGDEAPPIWVHVAGAVKDPGVYRMKQGQRVYEVLQKATPLEDADVDSLNLAEVLRDSQKIYVPKKGENPPSSPASSGHAGGGGSASPTPVFPINVNTASQSELEQLPGIGPVLASAIIARRDQFGPFERPEDLKEVPGIGDKTFARIAPLVTVK